MVLVGQERLSPLSGRASRQARRGRLVPARGGRQSGETARGARVARYRPASPDALLPTKLHLPSPRRDLLPRSRLLARLAAGLGSPLILVSAPAGSGKSSLLASWRRDAGAGPEPSLRAAWVSLDAGDDDPVHFWAYVAAALEGVYPGAGAPACELLRGPRPPSPESIVAARGNGLSASARD